MIQRDEEIRRRRKKKTKRIAIVLVVVVVVGVLTISMNFAERMEVDLQS